MRVGCRKSSCRTAVLVHHTSEAIATLDTSLTRLKFRRRRWTGRVGWVQGQRSVRAMDVIVIHEHGGNSLELPLVQNQQPIETLGTNGSHEPFRHTVRLWGTKRRANDLDARASKHLVKTIGELLVPVANQEAERLGAFRQRPG